MPELFAGVVGDIMVIGKKGAIIIFKRFLAGNVKVKDIGPASYLINQYQET
jgi:hypothetical protein